MSNSSNRFQRFLRWISALSGGSSLPTLKGATNPPQNLYAVDCKPSLVSIKANSEDKKVVSKSFANSRVLEEQRNLHTSNTHNHEQLLARVQHQLCSIVKRGRVCVSVRCTIAMTPTVTQSSSSVNCHRTCPKSGLTRWGCPSCTPSRRFCRSHSILLNQTASVSSAQALGFIKTSALVKHPQIANCIRTFVDDKNNQLVHTARAHHIACTDYSYYFSFLSAAVHGTSIRRSAALSSLPSL